MILRDGVFEEDMRYRKVLLTNCGQLIITFKSIFSAIKLQKR